MKTRSLAGAVLLMGVMLAGQDTFGIQKKDEASVLGVQDVRASDGATKKQRNESERFLKEAVYHYEHGDLVAASRYIERSLGAFEQNPVAMNLKQKIGVISGRMDRARASLLLEYYDNANKLYRNNSLPYALIFAKKAANLTPENQEAGSLFKTVCELSHNMIQGISGTDKAPLDKGITLFMKDEFVKAEKIFRSLQPNYPELNEFLSVSSYHALDKKNVERSREYFEAAMRSFVYHRFKKAQDELYLALEIDRFNIDARMMLEQVNFELGI